MNHCYDCFTSRPSATEKNCVRSRVTAVTVQSRNSGCQCSFRDNYRKKKSVQGHLAFLSRPRKFQWSANPLFIMFLLSFTDQIISRGLPFIHKRYYCTIPYHELCNVEEIKCTSCTQTKWFHPSYILALLSVRNAFSMKSFLTELVQKFMNYRM